MNIKKQRLILVKEQEIEYKNKIKNKLDVYDFIQRVVKPYEEPEEILYLITLSTPNRIISFMEVARGSINCCTVSEADIYKRILISNCRKFILVHNHPSGDSKPSTLDIVLTKRIKKTSELLELEFLDHIVVGDNECSSCFDNQFKNK